MNAVRITISGIALQTLLSLPDGVGIYNIFRHATIPDFFVLDLTHPDFPPVPEGGTPAEEHLNITTTTAVIKREWEFEKDRPEAERADCPCGCNGTWWTP